MARTANRAARSIRLKQKIAVEVREAPFKTFESIRHLDVARLSRAAHGRFEVGQFEAGCCRRIVHAVVRKGMVTKLEVEPCKRAVRMTPDMKKMIHAARKAFAARRAGSKRLPVAVNTFLAGAHGFTIDVSFCFMICVFGWCLICCFDTESPNQNNCAVFTDDWP
jgi:hypothetical protein